MKSKAQRKKSPRKPRKKPVKKNIERDLACLFCKASLSSGARVLQVEEENARNFCSEDCISSYFAPDVETLEREYLDHLEPDDLSSEVRSRLSHLRWKTLKTPDEVWREKTIEGDLRHYFIKSYEKHKQKITSVCITLVLGDEPSFLFLAFVTADNAMVERFRKGEPMRWGKSVPKQVEKRVAGEKQQAAQTGASADRVAEGWGEEDAIRAQVLRLRNEDDIPSSEYEMYEACIEETLQVPDELWIIKPKDRPIPQDTDYRYYHFLRHYPNEQPGLWYIIVARQIDEEDDQIEILDAFPTKDVNIVEHYRRGKQEIGKKPESMSRIVH